VSNALPEHVGPATPVAEAALAIMTAKLAPVFALEARTVSGTDAEALHDMRVASRRAREALAVIAPLFEPVELKRVSRTLRRITRALGPVRDADVFLGHFAGYASEAPTPAERATAMFLVGYRSASRQRDLVAMRTALTGLELGAKHARLLKSLAGFRIGADTGAPLASYASAILHDRCDRFGAHATTALVEPCATAQHAMRIDAKHLRYAIETLSPCIESEHYAKVRSSVVAYQDVLGAIHDCDVFSAELRGLELPGEALHAGASVKGLARLGARIAEERHAHFLDFSTLAAHAKPEALCEALADSLVEAC